MQPESLKDLRPEKLRIQNMRASYRRMKEKFVAVFAFLIIIAIISILIK